MGCLTPTGRRSRCQATGFLRCRAGRERRGGTPATTPSPSRPVGGNHANAHSLPGALTKQACPHRKKKNNHVATHPQKRSPATLYPLPWQPKAFVGLVYNNQSTVLMPEGRGCARVSGRRGAREPSSREGVNHP